MHGVRQKVGLLLGPVLFGAVYLMPLPRGMDPTALAVAAVAVLMAIWWITEAIPIPATSLLPIVLFPCLGVMTTAATTPSYAHELIFLFLGGFLLAIAMEKWKLHRRVALRTIALVGVGPSRIVLGFMVATAFLSMWVSNTATAMMMLPIGAAVLEQARESIQAKGIPGIDTRPQHFRFGTVLMLGICYAASIGGVATLIGTPPNTVFAAMADKLFGQQVGFASWMLFGVPLSALMLLLAWVILVKVAYPMHLDELPGGRELVRTELQRLGPMTRPERLVLVVFAATAAAWIIRGFVATTMVSDTTIAIAGALALFIIPADLRKGEFLLDWESAVRLPWGVMLLFGGGLALAKGVTDSGLADWIGQQLSLLHGLNPTVFLTVVAVLTFCMTEMTSNTATATLLMPIMGAAAVGMGIHPFGPMVTAAVASSYAFVLPVATPPNAVIYASGYVTIRQMAKAGVILNLVGAVLIALFASVLLPVLWHFDMLVLPSWAK